LLHATAAELRALVPDALVVEPAALAPAAARPWWSGLRLAWCAGVALRGGARCFVPAHAVHCPPPGGPPLGVAVVPWTSSGLAAHPDRDAALLHGLLELVERDQLDEAFPAGFAPRALAERLLAPASLASAAPRAAALAARLEARGFSVHLLDAGGHLGIATAAALLVDRDRGAVPVAAGYASRPGRDQALLAALLEAAQSRLTEIHGAREDVEPGSREAAWPLAERCARLRPSRRASALPDHRHASPGPALRWLLDHLARRGVGPVVACQLDSPAGLVVVRVLVPGLRRSWLLG
jgi:ribosomal protein S12 methylthiotransferase accessory factor